MPKPLYGKRPLLFMWQSVIPFMRIVDDAPFPGMGIALIQQ